MLERKIIVKQNGYKDCGASCLLSIMRYYGCDVSHEEVTLTLKTTQNGTNAYNIINGSKLYGFDGYGIHYSYEQIINKEISFPIICHVKRNNMFHFIVVYQVNKKYLTIMDPASNVYKISYEEFKNIYLDTSLVIYPIKKVNNVINGNSLKKYISSLLKEDKILFIKTTLFSIISIILSIIINFYMLFIFDYILPNFGYSPLIKLTIIFLILILFNNIFNYLKMMLVIKFSNKLAIKINNEIIKKLFNLPYAFFKNRPTSEVISRVNDLKIFKESFIQLIVTLSNNIIVVIFSMIILLLINFKLFLIFFLEIVIYIFIVLLYKNSIKRKIEDNLISEANYNKILAESIYSYESILNLNQKKYTIKNIEIANINENNKLLSYSNTINNQETFKSLFAGSFNLLSLFISAIFIHKKIITIGDFFLFNSIVYYFTYPLKDIINLYPDIRHIKSVYKRINDLILFNNKVVDESNKKIKGDIVFDNVSFSHNNLDNLFSNVSFNIKYGSKFLIYGKSGSGKSTIIKLLLKYVEDYKGYIKINNKNIKDINKNILSNSFTYVSQNNYLCNDTLKNNIVFYRIIPDEDYEKVIDICNLNSFRDKKFLRDNYVIEENGFNISGGERQKILLARSLLKKCDYLVLDEALSEVGLDEEKQIINKIFNLYKDKTIIYISHKKEIINYFNFKYKLERRQGC